MASTEPWPEAVNSRQPRLEMDGAAVGLAPAETIGEFESASGEASASGAAATTSETAQTTTATAPVLPPEDDEGAVEYKYKLVSPTPTRMGELVTQLNFRLGEGGGQAVYEIGVEDNGQPKGLSPADLAASLSTLRAMAAELDAEISVLCEADGKEGRVAQVLVRKMPSSLEEFQDVRIAVCGNVDSGKSTLVGVLSGNGTLDNGRGRTRSQVLTHRHEMETGRTSAVSQQIMGFGTDGSVVNYTGVRQMGWAEIVRRSTKLVSLLDCCGHERYLKTTILGMSGHGVDYCLLVVNANMGSMLRMCKEHLQIAIGLRLPVLVVVTKIDLAPPNIYAQTVASLQKLLKSPGARKLPVVVKTQADVVMAQGNIVNDRVVPIFPMSSVTGEGLDLLRSFLNLVPSRRNWHDARDKPTEFSCDETFMVPGVGTVVAGCCTSGSVRVGQTLHLGPDGHGHFSSVSVRSIEYKKVQVKRLVAGQSGALALKKVKRSQVRKGMVLMDSAVTPGASWRFTAEVCILTHSSSIRDGYQPVICCQNVRQAARVVSIEGKPLIRAGDRAVVSFQCTFFISTRGLSPRFGFCRACRWTLNLTTVFLFTF
jgi:GTPase